MLKDEAIIIGCFGTKDQEEFDRTFQKIYLEIKDKAKANVALALTNKRIAATLKQDDLLTVKRKLEGYKHVGSISLFMANGSQYQSFKSFCLENNYEVSMPLLEKYGQQVAEILNKLFPYHKDERIILLAHGNNDYDNHEYLNMQRFLHENFSICLAEVNDDLEKIVRQAKEKKVIVFSLMFSCGHHYKQQLEVFKSVALANKKDYEIIDTSLAQLQQFRDMLIKGELND